ncbi:MAG: proline dehydrogenase family protein [Ignavibacteriaceae bacterium]|nr:proline dehydrogenase family protein [Ignavibacteriaceae bacterium]
MSIFNKIIVSVTLRLPKKVVGFFSRKYIAGETLQDAINVVKQLNSKGIFATLDVLGESIKTREESDEAKKQVMQVLDAINKNNLMANLSVKPTQMGLSIDEEFCFKQISEVVAKANEMNIFVRMDMEDSSCTDGTIRIYRNIFEKFKNVGIVLQSYLKRTYSDTLTLNQIGTNYRLCKGIYIESPSIAYKDKQAIRDNFMKALEAMLKNGNYVGIATHDEYLVKKSYQLIKDLNISKDKFEFQMLLGVREDLRDKINSDGYKIRIYVPFGKDWYAYSMRRLKENPNVAGHIVKNIFSFRK